MKKHEIITDFGNYVVSPTDSLGFVMERITANHRGAALVVDETNKVLGVVSDGAIRRAFLGGSILETPINRGIINHNFLTLKEGAKNLDSLSEKIFEDNPQINLLSIVNDDGVLMRVSVRGGDYTNA